MKAISHLNRLPLLTMASSEGEPAFSCTLYLNVLFSVAFLLCTRELRLFFLLCFAEGTLARSLDQAMMLLVQARVQHSSETQRVLLECENKLSEERIKWQIKEQKLKHNLQK